MLALAWEAELRDTRMASLAAAREAAFPDTRVRARCPPLLPRELAWGLRLAAARAFKVDSRAGLGLTSIYVCHPAWLISVQMHPV